MSSPEYEPINMLVSQIEKKQVQTTIEWKKQGFVQFIIVDSGAFSVYTGRAHFDKDDYIKYINDADDAIDVFVTLDTIPGKWGQPRTKEDIEIAAEKTWQDFLYIRERIKCPEKLLIVHHQGEDLKFLQRILDYRDKDGKPLDYIGLSNSKDDTPTKGKKYLTDCFDMIKHSSNPKVKTHIFGCTVLDWLSKFPTYSSDSTSHRKKAAFGMLVTRDFGNVQITENSKVHGPSITHYVDDYNRKKLEEEAALIHCTLDDLKEDAEYRTAFNMMNYLYLIKHRYKYHPDNMGTTKKLFNL